MTRIRQEIEVLHDILVSLEEGGKVNGRIISANYMNSIMWGKYRGRMLEAGLISEGGIGYGRRIEITTRGREFLGIIGRYRSIWSDRIRRLPRKDRERATLRPWQEEVLMHVWERGGEGFTSREIWTRVTEVEPISRASVMKFLNRLTDDGVLEKEPRPGRGGIHGFYTMRTRGREFEPFLADIASMMARAQNGRPIRITAQ